MGCSWSPQSIALPIVVLPLPAVIPIFLLLFPQKVLLFKLRKPFLIFAIKFYLFGRKSEVVVRRRILIILLDSIWVRCCYYSFSVVPFFIFKLSKILLIFIMVLLSPSPFLVIVFRFVFVDTACHHRLNLTHLLLIVLLLLM